MRPISAGFFGTLLGTVALAFASVSPASAQSLVCPPVASAAGRPCENFHFHVQMFRPDTRELTEYSGINQFATAAACDRARDAQFKRNMAIVEFFRAQRRDWWQADRFGPCHCDMTVEKASPNFLTDAARTQQLHDAEEIRQRVRERLLDARAPNDGELIRDLNPPMTATPLIGGPKVVSPPPPAAATTVSNSPDDLRITRAVDTTPSSTASLDLPLVDLSSTGGPTSEAAPVLAPAPAPAQQPPAPQPPPVDAATPTNRVTPPEPAPAPAPVPLSRPTETVMVAADDPDLPAPEDVADAFVSYESQRIQNVLKVSGSIGDEAIKAQVLEACTQRIQLLSNLRTIIVGSGAKSRLVAAANTAKKESDRLAVVAKLFGSDIPPHWAPKDAKDVIFDPGVTEPEHVLRDNSASDQQKRHALYAMLATSSPTEQQQLWLTGVVEALLR
jgi:hypothetical protein